RSEARRVARHDRAIRGLLRAWRRTERDAGDGDRAPESREDAPMAWQPQRGSHVYLHTGRRPYARSARKHSDSVRTGLARADQPRTHDRRILRAARVRTVAPTLRPASAASLDARVARCVRSDCSREHGDAVPVRARLPVRQWKIRTGIWTDGHGLPRRHRRDVKRLSTRRVNARGPIDL